MSLLIIILALSLFPGHNALNVKGPEGTRGRVFNPNWRPGPGEPQIVLEQPDWAPMIRGQFMRDILFGIHPESPRNRDVWIRSGLLRPQNHQLRNIPQFSASGLEDQGRQIPRPVNKIKNRPLRRKIGPMKRLPKLTDLTEDSIKRNMSEANTNVSKPLLPLQLPKGLPMPVRLPAAQKSENLNVPSPRCFIQATVPVVYYLLPMTPIPFGSSPNKNGNIGPRTKPSLFETGQYAPIQNRLPYPPYPPRVVYLSPLPLDLLAMEGGKDEQKLAFDLASTKTPIPSASGPLVQSVPPKSMPVKVEAVKPFAVVNPRIPKPPKVIDLEFRGDTLPVETFSNQQKDDGKIFSEQDQKPLVVETVDQTVENTVEEEILPETQANLFEATTSGIELGM